MQNTDQQNIKQIKIGKERLPCIFSSRVILLLRIREKVNNLEFLDNFDNFELSLNHVEVCIHKEIFLVLKLTNE